MKLLYVSNGYTTHDRHFLQLFCGAGWSVGHLRLLPGGGLDGRPLPDGVEWVRWQGDQRSLKSPCDYYVRWRELRRILKDVKPNVVLAGPVPTAAFLVALAGFRPLVSMCWGSDLLVDAQRSRLTRLAARYALQRSAGAFGDCRQVADVLTSLVPLADDRLLTFPWGIDLNRFYPAASRLDVREKLGWTANPVFLCTRSWEPVYAIDVLVAAFATVYRSRPEARLILLGDGSHANRIHGLIDTLGLREVIHTPGRIGNDLLPDYFRLADVYVSATLSDGTSISLLEAMACALPVIVTEAYGNLEWVTAGRNGWLVAPGDAKALAAALLDFLATPSQRLIEMGRANAKAASARANWDANSPRLLDLLQRVARCK